MEQVPKSMVGTTLHLIIRTEFGTEHVQLQMKKKDKDNGCNFGIIVQSLAMKRFVWNNRILTPCFSFLFHRQSHITLQYTDPTRGPSLMHFILCSSELFLNPSSEELHFSASQCFVNVSHSSISQTVDNLQSTLMMDTKVLSSIPSTLEPQALTIIGILGPSVAYAHTGNLIKSALRKFAVGSANEQQGYSVLYKCLSDYAKGWKAFKKEKYIERVGFKARKLSPVNQLGSVDKFPQNRKRLERLGGQLHEQRPFVGVSKTSTSTSGKSREGALRLANFLNA